MVVINFANKVDQVFFETPLSFLLKCNGANNKHIQKLYATWLFKQHCKNPNPMGKMD